MSGDQLFILGILAQVVVVIGVVLTYLQGRENRQKLIRSEAKLDKLHIDVNSRLSQLLEQTGKAEHARGLVDARSAAEAVADAVASQLGVVIPEKPGEDDAKR